MAAWAGGLWSAKGHSNLRGDLQAWRPHVTIPHYHRNIRIYWWHSQRKLKKRIRLFGVILCAATWCMEEYMILMRLGANECLQLAVYPALLHSLFHSSATIHYLWGEEKVQAEDIGQQSLLLWLVFQLTFEWDGVGSIEAIVLIIARIDPQKSPLSQGYGGERCCGPFIFGNFLKNLKISKRAEDCSNRCRQRL